MLAANALYWLDRFHIDGLRVDAVASMLYLDYSRSPGEWTAECRRRPRELDAVRFLRQVNTLTYGLYPGTVTIAEEFTDWPGVSRPADAGGLGFGFKWNMGWMHDTLEYIGARSGASALSPRQADLRSALCVHGEFRPAAVA